MSGQSPSDDAGFGIYVHWPYCSAKCPYCDFNSHVERSIDEDAWAEHLCTELQAVSAWQDRKTVTSIFFGGGTPSLMSERSVARILEQISTLFPLDPEVEITLEANPTSVEAEKFKGFARAGVNRVSVGVQALNDNDLKSLGRLHNADEALAALAIARTHFARVSFDLIYARSGQDLKSWQDELCQALTFAPDHLSLYQLTIEQGTPFAALAARGVLDLPDEDLAAEMFTVTNDLCASAGLNPYEISNYARQGSECRHNLTYWRYGDYIGVGPGAHGRLSQVGEKSATYCLADPKAWAQAIEQGGHAIASRTVLSKREQGEEMLLMGLRLLEGVDLAQLKETSGLDFRQDALAPLSETGFVTFENDRLRATMRGRNVLNRLISEIIETAEVDDQPI